MNGERFFKGTRACAGCGSPLEPDAAACASCGRLVAVRARASTRMEPPLQILLGVIVGLVLGLPLSLAVLGSVISFAGSAGVPHLPMSSEALAFLAMATLLIAILAAGTRLVVRGWVFLGTLAIVTGIVAIAPAAACDALLSKMTV